jgi:hypothetical protein
MSTAIVVRSREDVRHPRAQGLGQSASYDAIVSSMRAIGAYINSLPDSSLVKAQLINEFTAAMTAFRQFYDDTAGLITDQQKQINALAQTSKTATTTAENGVSSGVAAAIAVGSAVAGGIAGYAVRGRK